MHDSGNRLTLFRNVALATAIGMAALSFGRLAKAGSSTDNDLDAALAAVDAPAPAASAIRGWNLLAVQAVAQPQYRTNFRTGFRTFFRTEFRTQLRTEFMPPELPKPRTEFRTWYQIPSELSVTPVPAIAPVATAEPAAEDTSGLMLPSMVFMLVRLMTLLVW